jgi:hypothetical protein
MKVEVDDREGAILMTNSHLHFRFWFSTKRAVTPNNGYTRLIPGRHLVVRQTCLQLFPALTGVKLSLFPLVPFSCTKIFSIARNIYMNIGPIENQQLAELR